MGGRWLREQGGGDGDPNADEAGRRELGTDNPFAVGADQERRGHRVVTELAGHDQDAD